MLIKYSDEDDITAAKEMVLGEPDSEVAMRVQFWGLLMPAPVRASTVPKPAHS